MLTKHWLVGSEQKLRNKQTCNKQKINSAHTRKNNVRIQIFQSNESKKAIKTFRVTGHERRLIKIV